MDSNGFFSLPINIVIGSKKRKKRKGKKKKKNYWRKTALLLLLFKMNPRKFDELLSVVGPRTTTSSFRNPISVQERLAITLRFLTSGDPMTSICYLFLVGKSTV